MDEALPDALYYAGIYGLILLATTITVSVTIPLFSCLAGGLFFVSGIMLLLYLPAATHLKKLRMGAAGMYDTVLSLIQRHHVECPISLYVKLMNISLSRVLSPSLSRCPQETWSRWSLRL